MEVHGDEEWLRNYKDMSEADTWPRDTTDRGEGHYMEEENMNDRVAIDQEGDIIERYGQLVITRPDWTTDHLTGMTKSYPRRERPSKIGGTGLATSPLNRDLGTDETPPDIIRTVEKMMQLPERDTLYG